MDERVNDFLNEINEIAPLTDLNEESVWEKCYDDTSGHYYYWNIKTNVVTWDMPPDYTCSSKPVKTKAKTFNLYIPPRTIPLFPSSSSIPPVTDAIKIYKIADSSTVTRATVPTTIQTIVETLPNPKDVRKRVQQQNGGTGKKNDICEDKKVVLISSYGDDTDESDAEELTQLSTKETINGSDIKTDQKVEPTAAFSLIAGYSDSEEEEEEEELKASSEIDVKIEETEPPRVAHSTLFPVVSPIDFNDFIKEETTVKFTDEFDDNKDKISAKAFQRKRRIGVALFNTGKKKKEDNDVDTNKKGLENSNEKKESSQEETSESKVYQEFKSGGVIFVKSDVLDHTSSAIEPNELTQKADINHIEVSKEISKEIEIRYTTLKEKLCFLSEGRDAVSPVQIMLLQIETLVAALKNGALKETYLIKWLNETCSDLIKLEKETTPAGWLLQWDRSHKRYYYFNETTGETQWDYPDVTRCDEAMDICTTPPPSDEAIIRSMPPAPPVIRSPSPPPPPIISENGKKNSIDVESEPLPPGVEPTESKTIEKDGNLNDALNSFYSDIAAIETTSPAPAPAPSVVEQTKAEILTETTKKKKKSKVKLTEGLAMKKKGVSKLVEKWKNVQLSYND